MNKTLFILGTILFQLNCFSQGAIHWQNTLGGSVDEYANSIQQTMDGGYIIAGMTSSTDGDVTGNHGSSDYWIVKMSATGTIQWQKAFGGSGTDNAKSIQETSDGGYIVAGMTNSTDGDVTGNHGGYDCWIVKLNATGTIQWQKTLGGLFEDAALSVQQTADEGYIIAGYTGSTDGDISVNHGYFDYWVVKLNTTGTIQWQKTLGGTFYDYASSIQQTTDGGYIVAGSSNSYDGDITGSLGTYDYWIVKLNATGTIQWEKSFGGSYIDDAYSIQQTMDGGYIVAGKSNSTDYYVSGNHGGDDYWVVKLSAAGMIQWQKTLGGSGYDVARSIQQTTDGGYIVAGVSHSMDGDVTGNHGGYDCWVVKLNATGIIQWQKALGGSSYDNAFGIQQTADGGYIVAGTSSSIDGDLTRNQGDSDYWVVKLAAEPLSTSSFQQGGIVIYPNPIKSTLNLQLPNDLLIDKIIIVDLAGKIIIEQTKNPTQVKTENLASGIYLIQAISGKNKWQDKFVKE